MYNIDGDEVVRQFTEFLDARFATVRMDSVQLDGQIHRFRIDGDSRHERSGAYCVWTDGWPAGWVRNWRTGEHTTWHFSREALGEEARSSLSEEQYNELLRKARELQAQSLEALKQKQLKASDWARAQFSALLPAPENFSYFVRKNVPCFGLRFKPDTRQLAVPLRNIEGNIQSIQWIDENGKKKFFEGAPTVAAFWSIALDTIKPAEIDGVILVGEGYATMATVYELTGLPCVAAMTCHNLLNVGKALHAHFQNVKIIFIADNDHNTDGNPGFKHATDADRAICNAGIVLPPFSNEDNGTDWNDYRAIHSEIDTKRELWRQINFSLMPKNIQGIHQHVTIINAQTLRSTVFPPITWAVHGFLPAGLSILAGGPKIGKSILALQLSLGVAIGGCVLGKINVKKGSVLYLALEDTQRRIQERINGSELQGDNSDLSALDIITELPRQHQGGLTYIQYWLDTHKDARLVTIDTLQMFRKQLSGKGSMYSEDYEVISSIKNVADAYNVPFLLLHHLKKGMEGDWLSEISGSQGIAGAADTIFSLKRERNSPLGTLHRTGRDVEEKDFILKLDGYGWVLQGEAEDFTTPDWKRQILDFLKDNPTVTPLQLAVKYTIDPNTAQKNLQRLMKEGLVQKIERGTYTLTD